MKEFEVGDEVVCVSDKYDSYVTLGSIYTIRSVKPAISGNQIVYVRGKNIGFSSTRFKLVEPPVTECVAKFKVGDKVLLHDVKNIAFAGLIENMEYTVSRIDPNFKCILLVNQRRHWLDMKRFKLAEPPQIERICMSTPTTKGDLAAECLTHIDDAMTYVGKEIWCPSKNSEAHLKFLKHRDPGHWATIAEQFTIASNHRGLPSIDFNGGPPMNKKQRKRDAQINQRTAEKMKQHKKNAEIKRRKEWEWEFTISSKTMLDINEVALTLRDDRMVAWILPKAVQGKQIVPSPPTQKKRTQKQIDNYREAKRHAAELNKTEAARIAKETAESEAIVVIHRRIVIKAHQVDMGQHFPMSELPCGHAYIRVKNATYIKMVTAWIKKVKNTKWHTSDKAFTVKYPKI